MASKSSTLSKLDFTGRRVLVTGGASGIGKAIAIKFLELNATVVVLDKDVPRLGELVREYPSVQTVTADLRNWDETRRIVESVLPIHHLANNAGIVPSMSFLDIDLKHIDIAYDINFKAPLNVAQTVAKGMIANNITNGTIVNTSSIADVLVTSDMAVYASTKAALTMLTKSMAVELAPHGIRVNCVSPGLVNTEVAANLPDDYKEKYFGPILERFLFHEITEPEAVADSIVFLSSPLSSRITAARIVIDQGTTVQ